VHADQRHPVQIVEVAPGVADGDGLDATPTMGFGDARRILSISGAELGEYSVHLHMK
jgi:hypothetical protein